MARLALAAPSTPIVQWITASALPSSESNNLATGSSTGFTFPNNGYVVVRYVVGAAGTGNVTMIVQQTVDGLTVTNRVVSTANSTIYLWGPFKPSIYNDAGGLVNFDIAVYTGNSVGVYVLPQGFSS